ncbi:DUF2341 domain-containing protein [Actinophytocola sp. NPDC049390]|uniref:DUF2341 domain-containing protein n=1 Tax=Actinophytocola sp. NPDC049390 TaxID=3363894 RepID=UPI003796C148
MNGVLGRAVRVAATAVAISLASTLFVTPAVPVAAEAQAGWLDSAWLYRRPVTVTNTLAQERTNQQVTVSLSAANFDFTRSSGQDIRFTDSDGTTLLNHWLDEYNTTSRLAWFVVRVPALPASAAKTIYMYYGNTNAPPASSGAKTFAFYDGFERLLNAPSPSTTPTYDGSGQAVHPDVVHFPQGWNGFRYWMAETPYPGSNDKLENPSILVSNDGLRWSVPPGGVNPLVPTPPCDHNNDPDMLYNDATGELWMYYLDTRRAKQCAGHESKPYYDHNYLKLIRSSDGVHWTAPVVVVDWVLAIDPLYIAPTIVKQGSTYHLWAVNSGTGAARTASSANGLSFANSQAVYLADAVWHFDVEFIPDRNEYWMFLDYPSTPEGIIRFARSTNRVNWTTYANPALTYSGGWDKSLYRSSFTFDPVTNQVRLWYSAHNGSKVWRIGHTGVDYADLINGLTPGGGWRREQGNGTWSTSTVQVRRGALSARLTQATGTSMALSKPQPLANSFFFEADIYDDLDSTAFKMVRITNGSDNRVGVGVWTGASTSRYVFHTKTYAYTVTSVARSQRWHRFAVLGNPDGSMVFSIDGRTVGTITGQFADANQVQVEGYNGGTTTYDVDDLRIRRWTGPEPPTSVGAEEIR